MSAKPSTTELEVYQRLAELLSEPEAAPGALKRPGLLIIPVEPKGVLMVDVERLLTLSALSPAMASAAAAELAYALSYGDRVSLLFTIFRLLSTVGVGARGRSDIVKLMSAAKSRMVITTTMSRFRRLLTGGRQAEVEEPSADEELQG